MEITYLGHNAFIIHTNGNIIMMDPFFMSEVELPEKVDYLLLTHAHQDHIKDAETILKKYNPTLIAAFEVANHFEEKGYSAFHMNHGGDKDFAFGNVKLVNAIHSSSFQNGDYGGNSCGFVITCSDGVVYFAGDTALTMDMKLIPMTCQPLDLAVLPIGNVFTMGYKDACIAADFVQCRRVLGCHYDTFPPIEINKLEAKEYFTEKGKELILLEIGNTLYV